jgi:hypothetical protein
MVTILQGLQKLQNPGHASSNEDNQLPLEIFSLRHVGKKVSGNKDFLNSPTSKKM